MQPFNKLILLRMSDTFSNMRTSRVIPTDTKRIFSPEVSRKSTRILWKEFFNNRLNWRMLKVWQFMYCPVVFISPDSSFDMNGKQRKKGAFLSPTLLYSSMSLYVMSKCRRTISYANFGLWRPFPRMSIPKSFRTYPPNTCPKSVLQFARLDSSLAR